MVASILARYRNLAPDRKRFRWTQKHARKNKIARRSSNRNGYFTYTGCGISSRIPCKQNKNGTRKTSMVYTRARKKNELYDSALQRYSCDSHHQNTAMYLVLKSHDKKTQQEHLALKFHKKNTARAPGAQVRSKHAEKGTCRSHPINKRQSKAAGTWCSPTRRCSSTASRTTPRKDSRRP